MIPFTSHQGAWSGSNGFRMMPTDPFFVSALEATVAVAAGSKLLVLSYGWTHPEDGTQDGLLVAGPSDEQDEVNAFWGDSWHQTPSPRVLTGVIDHGKMRLAYTYAGDWQWQITLDATEQDVLRLQMANVVPESAATEDIAAGSYLAMDAELRRGE